MAERLHSEYLRTIEGYDQGHASNLLYRAKFPQFCSLCKTASRELYFRLLTENLAHVPREQAVLHRRFCESINRLKPARILTTNVDESLERGLPRVQVLQRTNLQRAVNLQRQRETILCKLQAVE